MFEWEQEQAENKQSKKDAAQKEIDARDQRKRRRCGSDGDSDSEGVYVKAAKHLFA